MQRTLNGGSNCDEWRPLAKFKRNTSHVVSIGSGFEETVDRSLEPNSLLSDPNAALKRSLANTCADAVERIIR